MNEQQLNYLAAGLGCWFLASLIMMAWGYAAGFKDGRESPLNAWRTLWGRLTRGE